MLVIPSLRHCSNKYKLAREGEKDKEKDEDIEKGKEFLYLFFFFLLRTTVYRFIINTNKS